MILKINMRISAAHSLPNVKHKCLETHGHNYKIKLVIRGPLKTEGEEKGMIVDFKRVKGLIKAKYDHKNLNDVLKNPTAENLTLDIAELLLQNEIPIVTVEVLETECCSVVWENENL